MACGRAELELSSFEMDRGMGESAAGTGEAGHALHDAPTRELQWELDRREGVHAYRLGPDAAVEITVVGVLRYAGPGPMTVTVNRD